MAFAGNHAAVGLRSVVNDIARKLEENFLHKSSSNNLQVDALDGLRGGAVLLVLLGHMTHSGLTSPFDFSGAGTLGVYLFFVLSSFLLTVPFLLRPDGDLNSLRVWKNYGFRRILRIYPLYVILLVFYYLLSIFNITPVSAKLYFQWSDIVRHLSLLDGKTYLWTIKVETTFYLILPVVVWSLVKGVKKNVLLTVPLVIGVIYLLTSMTAPNESRESILLQFPVFLIGSTAALIYCNFMLKRNAPMKCSVALDSLAVLVLMVIISFIPSVNRFIFSSDTHFSISRFPFIFGLLWAVFLLLLLQANGIVNRMFSSRFIRFIGVISFSVYLWHVPILAVFKKMAMPEWAGSSLSFMAIITIASFSYQYIERPFLSIRLPRR